MSLVNKLMSYRFALSRSSNFVRFCSQKPVPAEKPPVGLSGTNVYSPTSYEKRFLVWSGKYKKIDDVPKYVSVDAMERARSKARIRIANYMILATIIGSILMVISGKKAASRGESIHKMNLEWHEKYKTDQK